MISVHIPAHNAQRFLEETLESVLAQDYESMEVLVGDDRSSDRTKEIISAFSSRDPRIRGLSNDGRPGAASCRNSLLRRMDHRATYVAIVDADDVCMPGRFVAQVAYLREHPEVAMVGSAVEFIDAQSRPIGARLYPQTPTEVERRKLIENPFAAPSVMVRADVLRAVGGYDEGRVRLDDYDLWLRLLKHHRGANLPQKLLRYRLLGEEKARKARAILWAGCVLKARHARINDWFSVGFTVRWTMEAVLSLLPGSATTWLFFALQRVRTSD